MTTENGHEAPSGITGWRWWSWLVWDALRAAWRGEIK